MGREWGAFLALNKVSGHLALARIDSMEMINATDQIEHLKKVVKLTDTPDKCHDDIPDGKSGNRTLEMSCVFCEFKQECWKDANGGTGLRKFKYSNGPKYLTQVAKEPKVLEIT